MTPLESECWKISRFATTHPPLSPPTSAASPNLPNTLTNRRICLALSRSGNINCTWIWEEKGVSLSVLFCIQAVCGLRFLYSNTLHRPVTVDRIPLPRYEKKLPVILSPAEVKALLETPRNLSHRAILTTMYAAIDPRISEVAKLKVADIDSSRNVIWIRGGKGRKRPAIVVVAKTAGVAACLLPLETAHRVANPRSKNWPADHLQVHLPRLSGGGSKGRHRQGRSSALAATRLRHSPAGCGRKSPHHSDPARPRKFGDHRPLSARQRYCGALDHQSIGAPGPLDIVQAATTFQLTDE